jgi:hypothetical protein
MNSAQTTSAKVVNSARMASATVPDGLAGLPFIPGWGITMFEGKWANKWQGCVTLTEHTKGVRLEARIYPTSLTCFTKGGVKAQFCFPFLVPPIGSPPLEDDSDAIGRIMSPGISLENESWACAMALWHSKWAIKPLSCYRRTTDQLATSHHTFCTADHWLKWHKAEHEYITHSGKGIALNILTSSWSFSIFSSFNLRAACSLKQNYTN